MSHLSLLVKFIHFIHMYNGTSVTPSSIYTCGIYKYFSLHIVYLIILHVFRKAFLILYNDIPKHAVCSRTCKSKGWQWIYVHSNQKWFTVLIYSKEKGKSVNSMLRGLYLSHRIKNRQSAYAGLCSRSCTLSNIYE